MYTVTFDYGLVDNVLPWTLYLLSIIIFAATIGSHLWPSLSKFWDVRNAIIMGAFTAIVLCVHIFRTLRLWFAIRGMADQFQNFPSFVFSEFGFWLPIITTVAALTLVVLRITTLLRMRTVSK